jgi:tRNA modification GTPase
LTQGLRETSDIVEQKALNAHTAIRSANLVLHLIDSSQHQPDTKDQIQKSLTNPITVFNKIDLLGTQSRIQVKKLTSEFIFLPKPERTPIITQNLDIAGWQNQPARGGGQTTPSRSTDTAKHTLIRSTFYS